MTPGVFIELTLLLMVTAAVSGLMSFLKQPLIIGYIISGVIVGPFLLNIISTPDAVASFAQIGVVLLLFFVGLSLNPRVIREVGKVSLITGLGQVIFTSLLGFLLCRWLGFAIIPSAYIAVALTFSSTIIIMKLLSDRRDLESLYGRIAIGFLIVQDLVAIFAIVAISSLSAEMNVVKLLTESAVRGAGVLILLFLISYYLLPRLIDAIGRSQEFLLLFSLVWCFAIASTLYTLNFSFEAGALLAGISLSLSPYHYEISSKIKPLRDFFLVLFFILLGTQMVFSDIGRQVIPALILSGFILLGNPLVVMALMGMLGYTKRNGFMAGLTVAQISEFSLVLIALGVQMGHLDREVLSLVTLVGLITIAGSTYMIIYADRLYAALSKYLVIFERKGIKIEEYKYRKDGSHDIILFGCSRTGMDILEALDRMKKDFLVVDYSPDVISKLAGEGYSCRYGDAGDVEMLNELGLAGSKMVISTIPDPDTNHLLLAKVRAENKSCIVIVVSHRIDEALDLYAAGATYVIIPHLLGGRHAAALIESSRMELEEFIKEQASHIESLKRRQSGAHERPNQ